MTPIGILIISATVLTLLFAKSRRTALFALIAGSIYVTQGQALYIAGLNIFSVRIYEVAGIYRIFSRKEFSLRNLVKVDKVLITLYIFTAVVYCLRASDSYANAIGVALDWTMAYLICRALLTGMDDLIWLLQRMVILLVPYVVLVYLERSHGQSMWYSMGGVSTSEGWTRFGAIRCTGSFRHPSLMGSFGASFLGLYITMICANQHRRVAYWGAIMCILIVIGSNSGGPLNFAAINIVGWCAWRFRRKVGLVVRALPFFILALAMFMKAPVWFVLQRISDLTGGDGWHRAELIDQAVNHMRLWWFDGMDLSKTVDWFEYVLPNIDSADICNQFVLYGLEAGIGAIILFIVALTLVFRLLARAMAVVQSNLEHFRTAEYFVWGLGVLLVGHIFNWMGITYFDQFYLLWALQLSAMVTISLEINKKGAELQANTSTASAADLANMGHQGAEDLSVVGH
jgi:hypothetical protein